jgi:hypothetical protein
LTLAWCFLLQTTDNKQILTNHHLPRTKRSPHLHRRSTTCYSTCNTLHITLIIPGRILLHLHHGMYYHIVRLLPVPLLQHLLVYCRVFLPTFHMATLGYVQILVRVRISTLNRPRFAPVIQALASTFPSPHRYTPQTDCITTASKLHPYPQQYTCTNSLPLCCQEIP